MCVCVSVCVWGASFLTLRLLIVFPIKAYICVADLKHARQRLSELQEVKEVNITSDTKYHNLVLVMNTVSVL